MVSSEEIETLDLDSETYSETDIKVGTWNYTQNTEVMLISYAINQAPAKLWDRTLDPMPPDDLLEALRTAKKKFFHNAPFDLLVMLHDLADLAPPIEEVECSMVQALAHSMPGGLDRLCEIFNIDEEHAKKKDGKQLIHLFCKPRPKGSAVRRATRLTHPDEWKRFGEYAITDAEAQRAVRKKLPRWNSDNKTERDLWLLDQKINRRGIKVDMELVRAALATVKLAQADLADQVADATDGVVASATQRDALLGYILAEYGVDLPDLKSSTLERRIDDQNLPSGVRQLLAMRLQASRSSTSKYKSFTDAVDPNDHRLRMALQFLGAQRTGRWAARKVQPQNFTRPTMKPEAIKFAIEAIKGGYADLIYRSTVPQGKDPHDIPTVMSVLSNALRGCFIADEGKKLCVADLSNIEGRGAAWLAGEEWKLEAFRMFDTFVLDDNGQRISLDKKGNVVTDPALHNDFKRKGPDLYKLAYAKAFAIDPNDVDSAMRQIGKVMELALGYQGGVGAFVTFALVYKMDLQAMTDAALPAIPDDIREEAESFYDWLMSKPGGKRSTFGLPRDVFVACDSLKRLWRNAHPEITSMWRELEDGCALAINGGKTVRVRNVVIDKKGTWMRIRLPSGRYLCYPGARCEKGKISYMGVNPYTRQWGRISTYGGKLFENITQALARDVLCDGMLRVEADGYPIVLTIHDEIITETPDNPHWGHLKLAWHMSQPPKWAPDIPLAAAGFEDYRYGKH